MPKDGSLPELETGGAWIEDADAGDVAWEEVGRELDSLERAADTAGDGLGEDRLANPRDIFNQDVPSTEECNQDELNLAPLPDDYPLNVVADDTRQRLNSWRDTRLHAQ